MNSCLFYKDFHSRIHLGRFSLVTVPTVIIITHCYTKIQSSLVLPKSLFKKLPAPDVSNSVTETFIGGFVLLFEIGIGGVALMFQRLSLLGAYFPLFHWSVCSVVTGIVIGGLVLRGGRGQALYDKLSLVRQ